MGSVSIRLQYLPHIIRYMEELKEYVSCVIQLWNFISIMDRLCCLVVRVSGYRYRGLGFDSRRYQIFCVVVGLERGPLSLVRSIEELLE